MRKILSLDCAIIEAKDVIVLEHPTTIFTEDWVNVYKFRDFKTTVDYLPKIKQELFEKLPENGDRIEDGKCYLSDGKITIRTKAHLYCEAAKPFVKVDGCGKIA